MAAAREPMSWMLARLERETRDYHAQAERDRFAVLDDPTLAGYRRFLATIYHFEYAVEARLVYVDELPIRFVQERLRSGRLGDDLLALGSDRGVVDVLAKPIVVPRMATAVEALGWIYVVQRNTLQHAALYRALASRLRNGLQPASRYLTAFANDAYKRWHELGAQLDHVAVTPERATRLVATAQVAFAAQYEWYLRARALAKPRAVEARTGA